MLITIGDSVPVFQGSYRRHAIDGRTEGALTVPCGDVRTSNERYVSAVRKLFASIKGIESRAPTFATIWWPVQVAGPKLIERVEVKAANGASLVNIIYHGIGGDYLTASTEAHEQLSQYLAQNRKEFWIDIYINIIKDATENGAPGLFRK